jgi:hypothetical protein
MFLIHKIFENELVICRHYEQFKVSLILSLLVQLLINIDSK